MGRHYYELHGNKSMRRRMLSGVRDPETLRWHNEHCISRVMRRDGIG